MSISLRRKTLQQIVAHAETAGYLNAKCIENRLGHFRFETLGERLRMNVQSQWQIVHPTTAITTSSSSACDPIDYRRYFTATDACPTKCRLVNVPPPTGDSLLLSAATAAAETILSHTQLCGVAQSTEMFSKILRQRKIWWMNFVANPQRISLSELTTTSAGGDDANQIVWIQSKFPFGNVPLEAIDMMTMPQNNRIRTTMFLDRASIDFIIDAIDDSSSGANEMCLHRNLAPYKCAILIGRTDAGAFPVADYTDLARYVELLLETNGLSVRCELAAAHGQVVDLETCFVSSDHIGIPYCLVLDDESLRTGLIKLRNRDTTLCETIHLSDVPDYLLKIFRN